MYQIFKNIYQTHFTNNLNDEKRNNFVKKWIT